MGVRESVLTLLGACTTLPRPSPPTTAITTTSHKSLPPPLSRQSVNRFDVESALEEQALQAALARSLKQEKPRVSCSVVVHARHKYKVYVLICTAALRLVSGVPIVLPTSLFPPRPSARDTCTCIHSLTRARTHASTHKSTHALARVSALSRSRSHTHTHTRTHTRPRLHARAAPTQQKRSGDSAASGGAANGGGAHGEIGSSGSAHRASPPSLGVGTDASALVKDYSTPFDSSSPAAQLEASASAPPSRSVSCRCPPLPPPPPHTHARTHERTHPI
jgi:hypothetical protein